MPAAEAAWRGPDGDGQPAAVGCGTGSGSEWLCVQVRCVAKGDVALFGLMTGEILDGEFQLRIDGAPFAVTGRETVMENASSRTRLDGDTAAIIDAMKRGSLLVVHHPSLRLTGDFDRIALKGSSRAIAQVERMCGLPAKRDAVAGGDGLLRNAAGKVSLGGLNNSKGCAEAKGIGTVIELQRNGPGRSIDAVWIRDDRYGRELINVDALARTSDMEARRRTLAYLLMPGRRLATTVRGCGAAARIQKLVSATEL